MALGLKQWLGLAGVGFLLVGLYTLPPTPLDVPAPRGVTLQAERRLNALREDAADANTTLQRVRWADVVIPATLAGPGPVVFEFPDGSVPAQAGQVRARTLAEVATDDTPSDVAVGVFFEDFRKLRYPGAPIGYLGDTHYYFGERDGRPYCAAVHLLWRQAQDGRLLLPPIPSDGSSLGVCALVRKYGLPGPAVRAWLAAGGTGLAATDRPGGGPVVFFRDVRDAASARRGMLGRRPEPFSYVLTRMDYEQCFAGISAGCAEMFLRPQRDYWWGPGILPQPRVISPGPASALQVESLFTPADYHVAANLAQEFGRDRFLAWWTADGDVATAFQASFGVDLGTWNLRRVGGFITVVKAGPGVSLAGLAAGALLLALSLIVSVLWARRRSVA